MVKIRCGIVAAVLVVTCAWGAEEPPSYTVDLTVKPSPPARRLASDTGIGRVAVSTDERLVAGVGADRTIRIWDTETGNETRRIEGLTGALRWLAFSDGLLLGMGSADPAPTNPAATNLVLFVWDPQTGQESRRIDLQTHKADSILCSQTGAWVAVARNMAKGEKSEEPNIRCFNARDGRCVLTQKSRCIEPMAFSANGSLFATSDGAVLRLPGCETVAHGFYGKIIHPSFAAFTHNGARLIAGGPSLCLAKDVKTGELIHEYPGDADSGERAPMAVSPDGRTVVVEGRKRWRIMDAETGEVRGFLVGIGRIGCWVGNRHVLTNNRGWLVADVTTGAVMRPGGSACSIQGKALYGPVGNDPATYGVGVWPLPVPKETVR